VYYGKGFFLTLRRIRMSRSHWALIVAIIAIVNPWMIFVLKEYLERRRTASEKPDRNQPEHSMAPISRLTVREFLRDHWRGFVIQWLFNVIAVFILLRQYQSDSPVTQGSVVLTAITVGLWLLVTLIPYLHLH
jgi:hypothetical protein